MDFYQFYSYDSYGVKTGPTLRVTSWNHRNEDVEFTCGENDSGERSRDIMALLFFFKLSIPYIVFPDKCYTSAFNALIRNDQKCIIVGRKLKSGQDGGIVLVYYQRHMHTPSENGKAVTRDNYGMVSLATES